MPNPDIQKVIEYKITGNPTDLNKVVDDIKKKAGNNPINLKFEVDTSEIKGQIGKIQSAISGLTRKGKDGQISLAIQGVEDLLGQLNKINTSIETIVKNLSIRKSFEILPDIEDRQKQLDNYKNSLVDLIDKFKKTKSSRMSSDDFFNTDKARKDLNSLLKDLKEIQNSNGEISFASQLQEQQKYTEIIQQIAKAQVEQGNLTKEIKLSETETITLQDVFNRLISTLQSGENKGKELKDIFNSISLDGFNSQILESIHHIQNLQKESQSLNTELNIAQNREAGGINVSIDKSSIEELASSIQELKASFVPEEGATIGIKTEDVEKITVAFTELKNVIAEIRDTIVNLDFSGMQSDAVVHQQNELQEEMQETGQVGEVAGENISEGMRETASEVDAVTRLYRELKDAVEAYIGAATRAKSGNPYMTSTYDADWKRVSKDVYSSDIRQGYSTKAGIQRTLDDYLRYKERVESGETEIQNLMDSTLERLAAYVWSYKSIEQAAEIFGKKNAQVFEDVKARIQQNIDASKALEERELNENKINWRLRDLGIESLTIGDMNKLTNAAMSGGIVAFAEKVKELFGVEIPIAAGRATDAMARVSNETPDLSRSTEVGAAIVAQQDNLQHELQETRQEAENTAVSLEQLGEVAFRRDATQNSNQSVNSMLPAIREVETGFEELGETGIVSLDKISTTIENTIEQLRRLMLEMYNAYNGSMPMGTDQNIVDLDESQYTIRNITQEIGMRENAAAAIEAETESINRNTEAKKKNVSADDGTKQSSDGIKQESKEFDSLNDKSTKAAEAKRKFAEANQTVLASIKASLAGLSNETDAFKALNSLLKTMGKDVSMEEAIKGLNAIKELLSSPIEDNSMIKALQDLSAEGAKLENLATVLKNAKKSTLKNAETALGSDEKKSKKDAAAEAKAEAKARQEAAKAEKEQNAEKERALKLLNEINKAQTENVFLSQNDKKYIANESKIANSQYDLDLKRAALEGTKFIDEINDKTRDLNSNLSETIRKYADSQIQSLNDLQKKLNEGGVGTFDKEIQKLIEAYQKADSQIDLNNAREKLNQLLEDTKKVSLEVEKAFKSTDLDKWSSKISKDFLGESALNKLMPDLINKAHELRSEIEAAKKLDINTEEAQEHIKDLETQLTELYDDKKLDKFKKAQETAWTNLGKRIEEYMAKNTAMGRKFQDEFNNLKLRWDARGSAEDLKDIAIQFNNLEAQVAKAGQTGKSFFDMIRDRATASTAAVVGMYLSWYRVIGYIKEIVSEIRTLDTALLDLKKTTTMTNSELEDFYYNSSDIAKQTGVTTEEIISQAAAWSRLNKIGLLYGNV